MTKRWKTNWELKSLSYEELFNLIVHVIKKQFEDLEEGDVTLEADFVLDYDADSVDIVGILLHLEEMFRDDSKKTRIVVPTDKLGEIVFVEDLFNLMYEVLLGVENKMKTFSPIKPNYDALENHEKIGELYPQD